MDAHEQLALAELAHRLVADATSARDEAERHADDGRRNEAFKALGRAEAYREAANKVRRFIQAHGKTPAHG